MGRGSAARGQKEGDLRRGAWTADEDQKLVAFIAKNKGHGSWRTLPRLAGLQRCGKSCRLRWINYLRPDIKRGNFSPEEERTITQLHALMGNKWSAIAARMPGRTDNEVKNHWNTHLKKRLARMGLDPATHRPVLMQPPLGSHLLLRRPTLSSQPADQSRHARPPLSLLDKSFVSHMAQWELARLEAEARLSASSSSSPRIPPSPRSTWPTSLQPNSSGGHTLSPDSATSQRRTIIDSISSSSSPTVAPIELRAEPATYGSCNVHLKGISDWCAPIVSDSAVSALFISASDQNCGSNALKPRVLQRAGDEDVPLQVESRAGRTSSEAFNVSGCCPAYADRGLRGVRTPTTMAPLPSEDLQLEGPTAHHDIPPYFEDILLSTSPDQPCLSGSTSLWTQYVLDYTSIAMLPPSCSAC